MEIKKIAIEYMTGDNTSVFDSEIQELISETKSFAKNAYAPYSKFHVSACLRLESGEIIKGANVENASYPVSICAERTLLSHTISNYPDKKIKIIVVYVNKELDIPVSPCGMCRQSMAEAEERQKSPIELILVNQKGNFIHFNSVKDLLPLSFNSADL